MIDMKGLARWTRGTGLAVSPRRSVASLALALALTGLSGSCVPICGCSPVVQPEVIDSIEFDQPDYLLFVGSTTTVRVIARRGCRS